MPPPPSSRMPIGRILRRTRSLLGGLAWKGALLLLLVYGLLQVGVRSEFFRVRTERELSRRLGMPVRVGRIRATEGLNLKIRDVISVSHGAGIELRVVRVRWRLFRPRGTPMIESIRVDGWAATLAPDAAGRVQPALMGPAIQRALAWTGTVEAPDAVPATDHLAERPQEEPPDDASTARLWFSQIPHIALRWGTVRVEDANADVRAAASGLHVLWTSMQLVDDDRVSHLDVQAGEIRVTDGPRIVNLHLELIDTGSRQFLARLEAEEWGTAPRPTSADDEYRALLDAMD